MQEEAELFLGFETVVWDEKRNCYGFARRSVEKREGERVGFGTVLKYCRNEVWQRVGCVCFGSEME